MVLSQNMPISEVAENIDEHDTRVYPYISGGPGTDIVAENIDEHDTRVWRVVDHYTKEARFREDFSDVSVIGIDETSSAKGHRYVTLVVDIDKSKVIHVCEGKDSPTVSIFKKDFKTHGGNSDNIDSVCCDMSPAFISGIRKEFPKATITFDKFHVMKILNSGVDMVRREEVATNQELKNTRYIWLKNPDNPNRYTPQLCCGWDKPWSMQPQ